MGTNRTKENFSVIDPEPKPRDIVWTPEKVSRLWNFYSSADEFSNLYFSKQVGGLVFKYARRFIDMRSIRSILDYGCGQGHMLRHLLSLTDDHQYCYGIDFSVSSVNRVNIEFSSHPRFKGATFLNSDSSIISDSSMDLIFVLEVVEHLDDQHLNMMKELTYRKLKNGGHIVITTPNRENLKEGIVLCPDCGSMFHRWQHIRSWSTDSVRHEMKAAGFQTVHVNETNFKIPHLQLARLLLKIWPEYRKNLIYIGKK
jgi:2-polyprenyl-3-methyl-5-hydroxy-6-metoxy-1,4-benzoquinol methylase